MGTTTKTQSEFYEIYKAEVQSEAPEFTDFSAGSMHDVIDGALSTAMNEISELCVSEFSKTYFATAHGPEVTGDVDNLQNLAVDHFGEDFERPAAVKSTGVANFERPTMDAGNVTIGIGVVVKTVKDANGEEIRFKTINLVTMTGLSINANIEADIAGVNGNVSADQITIIESTLTDDTVTVNNDLVTAGGDNAQDDATYRETIRDLIQALKGATLAAVKAAIEAVAGIEHVDLIEDLKVVIEYDIATGLTVGEFFRIAYPVAYIADAAGASSPTLIAAAEDAIEEVRAAGVRVVVVGGVGSSLNWTSSLTLNPGGPNFAILSTDLTMILDSMTQYINDIAISAGFVVADANAAMLAIWGPAGTDDITAFTTSIPAADVAGVTGTKLIPGVIDIV